MTRTNMPQAKPEKIKILFVGFANVVHTQEWLNLFAGEEDEPLASVTEWIEDGKNGLLAQALYPNELAGALHRALTDDDFVRAAGEYNRTLVAEQADRRVLGAQVLDYYRQLASNAAGK